MPSKKLTVAVTGGGTGGHIYPAVAVIQKLKNDPEIDKIYYIGCPVNMEKDIAEKEGVEFLPISISGMPRKTGIGLIKWLLELNSSVKQSISHLIHTKPDVIFGTGGYVSGPVLLAAVILRIPFVIHDSDAHPGVVSKFMALWAKAVSVAFEQAKDYLKSKNIVVNGNPIRANFSTASKDIAYTNLNLHSDKKTILVMGGSQGAKTINNAMLEVAPRLIKEYGFQVIHQTGRKNFEEYQEKISEVWPEYCNYSEYILRPYFDEMAFPLAAADLAVSRSGSLSLSELNLSGLPAILIPYPYAAADHQKFNAIAMEKAGAAIWLEDSKCNSDTLISLILELVQDTDRLKSMQEANKCLAKPYATDNIVKILKDIAKH
ncbi:MAG: undecaprenyldiphospho-muramoylpentapeptide beta-N-acetylglucosaminyltransferase [Candidatus Melainabacteria bacterium RIFOXYA12_FULL_32_12]|nr:MAG: undecaprenyldiphospho-muramoylpentapeptide beta-N-acetylglucosaminyltransferase [Candidatus Melainabacteria bacterium RIFOXYA12_FULL_32_12]